ncbi:hypothetical protein HMPREF9141_2676 [Prevotella multiformis DSM 16608]|uniref:Uncharacterized protein n=1 Tax=Prevotella multiformis DSM 16608 TaxID=888743 RepID=F0FAQ9_9BACT|nr:hypothetical protein HMPREF9141_2676 [Prevotella multiformis DSM 16608]
MAFRFYGTVIYCNDLLIAKLTGTYGKARQESCRASNYFFRMKSPFHA